MPNRRHSGRSMWLTPALVVTTKRREGRCLRTAAERGKEPEQSMASTVCAWTERNSCSGNGDSHGFNSRNFSAILSPYSRNSDGGPRTIICGSSFFVFCCAIFPDCRLHNQEGINIKYANYYIFPFLDILQEDMSHHPMHDNNGLVSRPAGNLLLKN